MSVRFRDACQGGGAYGKAPAAWPSPLLAHMLFGALSPESVDTSLACCVSAGNARRSRTAGASATE
ncbi:hypothetical protein GUO43_004750 [Salmonella enterica]|nr:hypothetical protein [Klebsiella pneumoniae]EDW3646837.1 hypothetical protein [Salmonella enterica]